MAKFRRTLGHWIRMALTGDRVLKDPTESLCPACLRDLRSRVVRSGRRVFLEKTCPEHGEYRQLIEGDARFYEAALRCGKDRRPSTGDRRIVFLATYRCNMACRLCYVPLRNPEFDLGPADVADVLERHPCKSAFFAGGEPTLMPDLPKLLGAAIAKGARPTIVTNGLLLGAGRMLEGLVRSGLKSVVLSLNALDRRVLAAVDGRDVLDEKMAAVNAMEAMGVPYYCSFSLVCGTNDREMERVYQFAADRYPMARGFYVDCLPGIGRSIAGESVFLSDLVERFGAMLGFSRGSLVKRAMGGKATLNAYSFSMDAGPILAERRGMTGHSPPFRVRCLTGMDAARIDLGETAHQDLTLSFSKISPVMPLWEFFIRCPGIGMSAVVPDGADQRGQARAG